GGCRGRTALPGAEHTVDGAARHGACLPRHLRLGPRRRGNGRRRIGVGLRDDGRGGEQQGAREDDEGGHFFPSFFSRSFLIRSRSSSSRKRNVVAAHEVCSLTGSFSISGGALMPMSPTLTIRVSSETRLRNAST